MSCRPSLRAGLVGVVMLAATSCSSDDDQRSPASAPTESSSAPTAQASENVRAGPQPLLPDMTTLRASGVRIEDRGADRLLRFGTTLTNIGVGPLETVPDRATPCPRGQRSFDQKVRQDRNGDGAYQPRIDTRAKSRGGACGLFHSTHLHWHIDGSSRYALLDRQGLRVAITRKVSFCLRDSQRVPGANAPTRARYDECARDRKQGISPGWGDLYDADLDGQTLPLRAGLAGAFCLRMTADPFDYFREADESNNASLTPLRIRGNSVTIGGPGCRDN